MKNTYKIVCKKVVNKWDIYENQVVKSLLQVVLPSSPQTGSWTWSSTMESWLEYDLNYAAMECQHASTYAS